MLAYFSLNDGRAEYRKFVLEGIEEGHRAEYYEAAEGRILGAGQFVQEIKTKSGEREKPKLGIKPHEFVEQVCKALGKKPQDVIGAAKNRERVRIRQILSYLGRNYTDLQVKVLATVLKVDPTCVSRCIAIMERRLGQDRMLRAEVRRVQNIIYISCLIPIRLIFNIDRPNSYSFKCFVCAAIGDWRCSESRFNWRRNPVTITGGDFSDAAAVRLPGRTIFLFEIVQYWTETRLELTDR